MDESLKLMLWKYINDKAMTDDEWVLFDDLYNELEAWYFMCERVVNEMREGVEDE